MNIAIWIQEGYNPKIGGGFSYYDRFIKAIDDISINSNYDLCFASMNGDIKFAFKKRVIKISCFPDTLRNLPLVGKLFRFIDWKLLKFFGDRIAANKRIGILVYLTQNTCFTTKIPFISTNWDIGHLSTFPFPELSSDVQYSRRNYFYENILPRALMVLADSEAGKNELLAYTRLGAHKIDVMPIFAGNVINIKPTIEVQNLICSRLCISRFKYFIYPAQYWPHKNHYGLIIGFKSFLKKYPDFKLLLCGSDKGNKSYIQSLVKKLDIQSNVLFLGFVSDEELASLYVNSCALVMASHFGPTNMPPIEALEMLVPVICSDIAGHREILGDAAVYFNSYDYDSISRAFCNLVENRDEYVHKVWNRKQESKFSIKFSIQKFLECMDKAAIIRNNWS